MLFTFLDEETEVKEENKQAQVTQRVRHDGEHTRGTRGDTADDGEAGTTPACLGFLH